MLDRESINFSEFIEKFYKICQERGCEVKKNRSKELTIYKGTSPASQDTIELLLMKAGWQGSWKDLVKEIEDSKKESEDAPKESTRSIAVVVDDPLLDDAATPNNFDRQLLEGFRTALIDAETQVFFRTRPDAQEYRRIISSSGLIARSARGVMSMLQAPDSFAVDAVAHGGEAKAYTWLEAMRLRLRWMLEDANRACKGLYIYDGDYSRLAHIMLENLPLMVIKSGLLKTYLYQTKGEAGTSYKFRCFSFPMEKIVDILDASSSILHEDSSLRFPVDSYTQSARPRIISNDANEFCLHYIDLDLYKSASMASKPTPTWDRVRARFKDDDDFAVFKAFVWSIYDARNHGRQILYLYDGGFTGKSGILNAVGSLLGEDACMSFQKDSISNQFSMAKAEGRRLITIGDNKNPNLIRSEKLHLLTGGDFVDCERKGKDSYRCKMDCKILASGNVPLQIDAKARNERTRVIPLQLAVSEEDLLKDRLIATHEDGSPRLTADREYIFLGSANYEDNLIKEFPYFLAKCRESYERLCPTHNLIQTSINAENNLISMDDDDNALYEELINSTLDVTNDSSHIIKMTSMRERFVEYNNDKKEKLDYSKFIEVLRRRYNITYKPVRVEGKLTKVFVGLRFKEREDVATSSVLEDALATLGMTAADIA